MNGVHRTADRACLPMALAQIAILTAGLLPNFAGSARADEALPAPGGLRRLPVPESLDYRAKWAIIIGIDDYSAGQGFENLRNAVNDARELRGLLIKEFGYSEDHVHFLVDDVKNAQCVGRERIRLAYDEWLVNQDLRPDDLVLFFFAGHGMRDPATGEVLIAAANSRADDRDSLLPVSDLLKQLSDRTSVPCRHRLIILDCCYAGAVFESAPPLVAAGPPTALRDSNSATTSAVRDIFSTYLTEEAYVGLSAGREQPVADGVAVESHSLFSEALLEVMRNRADSSRPDQAFTFRELAAQVEARVRNARGSHQVPDWRRLGGGNGDVVFLPSVFRLTPSQQDRRRKYSAAMTAAQIAWNSNDISRTHELLESVRPKQNEEDLRGFEWFYLWRISHAAALTLRGTVSAVAGLTFPGEGGSIRAVYGDGSMREWKAASGRAQRTAELPLDRATGAIASDDGSTWAVRGVDNVIRVWRRDEAKAVAELSYPPISNLLTISRSGNVLSWSPQTLAGPFPGKLVFGLGLWRWGAGPPSTTIHTDVLCSPLRFSDDGKQLAYSRDGMLTLLDVETKVERPLTVSGKPTAAMSVAFAANGSFAATVGGGSIAIWSTNSNDARTIPSGTEKSSGAMAFSSDGSLLASGGQDLVVRVHDVAQGRILNSFRGHTQPVTSVGFGPDAVKVASGDASGVVMVWNRGTQDSAAETGDMIRNVVVSPHGSHLAASSYEKRPTFPTIAPDRLVLYDLKSAALTRKQTSPVLERPLDMKIPVVFSQDDRYMAYVISADFPRKERPSVVVWDVEMSREHARLSIDSMFVGAITFLRDENSLAVLDGDGKLVIRRLTGGEVTLFQARNSAVGTAAISPSRRTIGMSAYNAVIPPALSSIRLPGHFIELRDMEKGNLLRRIDDFSAAGLAIDPGDEYLAAVGGESINLDVGPRSIRLWRISDGKLLWTTPIQTQIQSLLFSPDAKVLLVLTSGGAMRTFDVQSGLILGESTVKPSSFFATSAKYAASRLIIRDASGVRIVDPLTLEGAFDLDQNLPELADCTMSVDGRLITADVQGKLRIRDVAAARTSSPADEYLILLHDPSPEVQRNALDALATLRAPRAKPWIQKMAADRNADAAVRAAAVTALALRGEVDESVVSTLADSLSDPSHLIVQKAIIALQTCGPPAAGAVPELINVIKTQPGLARVAARAAIQIDRRSSEPLIAYLRHMARNETPDAIDWEEDVEFVRQASERIKSLDDKALAAPDVVLTIAACLDKSPLGQRSRMTLNHVIAGLGPAATPAVPTLKRLAEANDHDAAIVLASLTWQDPQARKWLVPQLAAIVEEGLPLPAAGPVPIQYNWLRLRAAKFLALLGADAIPAIGALRRASELDPNSKLICDLAIEAIQAGETKLVDILIGYVRGQNASLRATAIELILLLGPKAKAAEGALQELISTPLPIANWKDADKTIEVSIARYNRDAAELALKQIQGR
jgi:WD40 repeat protein